MDEPIICSEFEFPEIGNLLLCERDNAITGLHFARSDTRPTQNLRFEATPLLLEAQHQLEQYFSGTRKVFDLPLAPFGTPFQMKCWQALREIPYGTVVSYGDIARRIGSPRACRAVGGANHRNPISIIIPCHRVIGSNGTLTGFGGGLDIKRFLLQLEAKYSGDVTL